MPRVLSIASIRRRPRIIKTRPGPLWGKRPFADTRANGEVAPKADLSLPDRWPELCPCRRETRAVRAIERHSIKA